MNYTRLQILLHWASAALVLALVFSGLSYSYDFGDWEALSNYQIIGQVLICVLFVRIVVRLCQRPVLLNRKETGWQILLAKALHIRLYLCLISFVVTAYVSASALTSSYLLLPLKRSFARSDIGDILLEIHYILKWFFFVCIWLEP